MSTLRGTMMVHGDDIGDRVGPARRDARSRVRALAALGGLPRETVRLAAGSRLTHELTSILEPMWHSRESWLKTTGQEGLEALEVQKVRFDPVSPGRPWRPDSIG